MTVSQLTIDDLLSRVEGSTIDFKMTSYDFAGKTGQDATRKRAEFVKDIVAMYNTPRRESAYIVLGIKKHLDGTYDVVGVKSHVDDAELQSKFNEWVYPIPKFSYEPLTVKGQPIAIIEIPIRDIGPCLPLRDLPTLATKYYENTNCTPAEDQRTLSLTIKNNRTSIVGLKPTRKEMSPGATARFGTSSSRNCTILIKDSTLDWSPRNTMARPTT